MLHFKRQLWEGFCVQLNCCPGTSLHSWSFEISVKCADKDQPLTPLTHDVPNELAQNIFTNVSTVEIAEPAEPNFPGVRVQRCN